jgi:hypothetical protein
VPTDHDEQIRTHPATEVADQSRAQNDEWERHLEEENRHERGHRERDHRTVLESPASDTEDRLHDDRHHRRLQPEKEGLDHRCLLKAGVQ